MTIPTSLVGLSGRQYSHHVCKIDTNWLAQAGNYAFAILVPQGISWAWQILYIGEAGDLRDRMSSHKKWPDALRLGATHVLAHLNSGGLQARQDEERDLIRRYDPPLNVQERHPALGGLFDLAEPKRRALLLGGE